MRLPTPYNGRESAGWLWRNLTGPKRADETGVRFLPSPTRLNEITPRLRIAFLGDVMDVRGRGLVFDPAIAEFLTDADFLVANFEGTLTAARKTMPFDQVHRPDTLAALAGLFPPEKTYWSIANNHAADFGEAACRASIARLRERGYHVFGTADEPSAAPCPEVRLIAWTRWSNHASAFLPHGATPDAGLFRPGSFNIFYPHWGYELEWFPRRETVALGRRLLANCDAVIGHHPHTPQPVTSYPDAATGREKPLAFSLGDFSFCGPRFAFYRWGLMVKLEIGPTAAGLWAAGRVDWRFTRCDADTPGLLRVRISDEPPIREFAVK
jgi:hypothetical protein